MLTVGSLFSGIGGFEAAGERCGLRVAFQIEIDPFARRVLAKHWPTTERHADIRTVDPARLPAVELLCGGWPCQGNSVAGLRQGHADPRSGLFSEVLRLVDGLAPRPRWLVLENVSGLASVNAGRDFAACVHELRRRGYVGCVRALDAQHFGLAQRRRRLFFVCGVGAAGLRAVQLVLEGGTRHPAPRRPAGQGPAACIEASASGPGGWRPRHEGAGSPVTGPLMGRGGGSACTARDTEDMLVCGTVSAKWAKGSGGPAEDEAYNLVAHSLAGEGFDASEDGTGRDTPLVAISISGDVTPKLGREVNGSLRAEREGYVGTAASVRRLTPTECERLQGFPDSWTCLCGRNAGRSWPEADACRCPDGPRYRSLGNGVAVPVVEWIFRKILQAEEQAGFGRERNEDG